MHRSISVYGSCAEAFDDDEDIGKSSCDIDGMRPTARAQSRLVATGPCVGTASRATFWGLAKPGSNACPENCSLFGKSISLLVNCNACSAEVAFFEFLLGC